MFLKPYFLTFQHYPVAVLLPPEKLLRLQKRSTILYRNSWGQMCLEFRFWKCSTVHMPIPVAARSTVWICGRSLAGIAGSNPAGNMDICLLCVCDVRYRSLRRPIALPEESYRAW